jgi:F420-non-reducing hydrogenase iron-sulfur subunit
MQAVQLPVGEAPTVPFRPKILILSTLLISDPGIDFTGLNHLHYPATTAILRLPCSSMIRPEFILHALESGFDGVFVAADGTDCPFLPDCASRTAQRVQEAYTLLQERGIERERLTMSGICSVCGEAFVRGVKHLSEIVQKIGPSPRRQDHG